jgi:hypothetical protein
MINLAYLLSLSYNAVVTEGADDKEEGNSEVSSDDERAVVATTTKTSGTKRVNLHRGIDVYPADSGKFCALPG